MIAPLSKPCRKCGVKKPLTDFTTGTGYRDGRINTCKVCANAAYRTVYKPRCKSGVARAQKEQPTDFDLGLSVLSLLAKPGVELTLEDIAAWAGCTREYIRKVEEKALIKVRKELMQRGEWDEVQAAFRAVYTCREEGVRYDG